MVEKRHLPENVTSLRCPNIWDEQETWAWSSTLRVPLSDPQVFQFRQTQPGLVHEATQRSMYEKSALYYHPEALLYARRLKRSATDDRTGAWSGLPQIPASPYKPLSESQLKELHEMSSDSRPLTFLVKVLQSYESAGPFQVSECLSIGCIHYLNPRQGTSLSLGKDYSRLPSLQIRSARANFRNRTSRTNA
jgi:hypothetical protein